MLPATFKRTNIRLSRRNYLGRRLYFVTVCFEGRRTFASEPPLARWLVRELKEQSVAAKFSVHAYCVMPDHMHFLAEGDEDDSDLLNFVKSYKQRTGYIFEKRKQRLWQAQLLRPHPSPERQPRASCLVYLAKPNEKRDRVRLRVVSILRLVHGSASGPRSRESGLGASLEANEGSDAAEARHYKSKAGVYSGTD
jgi:REP element-mobilizing transposase RayT